MHLDHSPFIGHDGPVRADRLHRAGAEQLSSRRGWGCTHIWKWADLRLPKVPLHFLLHLSSLEEYSFGFVDIFF